MAASPENSVHTSNGLTENRLANIKTENCKIVSNILLYEGRNKQKDDDNIKDKVLVFNYSIKTFEVADVYTFS
jgi:hypothetical protein